MLQENGHPTQLRVRVLPPMKELRKHVHREVTDAIPPGLVPCSGIWDHVDEAPQPTRRHQFRQALLHILLPVAKCERMSDNLSYNAEGPNIDGVMTDIPYFAVRPQALIPTPNRVQELLLSCRQRRSNVRCQNLITTYTT